MSQLKSLAIAGFMIFLFVPMASAEEAVETVDAAVQEAAAVLEEATAAVEAAVEEVAPRAPRRSARLEEITVTARKREESLSDIPVSASVLSDALIEEAGITDLYDLFEMVPGLHYDEEEDRLAALPSIRGIQANDVAPNRTKVTAFIDGIPVLGSAGSIGFNGFQQVEVYRGPQSAAFGRSTFAGAINYVTRDPGEELEGSVGLNLSDYGTRTADFSFGGPIPGVEGLGFLLNYSKEDSSSPDEYHAVGNGGNRVINGTEINIGQSDGTEFGARSGDNLSAKFVFEPSDDIKVSFNLSHVETHDQRAPVMFLTQDERDACFENSGVFVDAGMMAPWLVGEMNCDWDQARDLYAQHDVEQWLIDNPLNLAVLVNNATLGLGTLDMGMGVPQPAQPFTLNDGTILSIEEQILLMARAYSVPEDDRGTLSERDRATFQFDKLFANDSALQFSYMQSSETYQRANATGFYYYDPDNVGVVDDGINNTFDMFSDGANIAWEGTGMGQTGWRLFSGMGAPRVPTPSFGEIDERYAELRWVSPAADRLRYVVGASYYDYDFLEERWGGPGMGAEALAGAAQLNGIVDEFMQLSGFADLGVAYAADDEIVGENAENFAGFFNLGYDITDKLTFSIEGRYQSDTVGATNETTGLSAEVTTKSFVPRIAFTFNQDENTSYYVQWAQGVNPQGINVGVLSADTLAILEGGVVNGLLPYDAALATTDLLDNATGAAVPDDIADAYDNTTGVWFTDATQTTPLQGMNYATEFGVDDFTSYKEEQISQLEFGFKGNLLDGRLTYAGAIYMIDWEDQIQNGAIDLDSPCASGADAGDPDPTLAPCTSGGADYLYVAAADGGNIATNLNFGDVAIYGAEIEGNFRINQNWDVRAQASYMKGEYDTFCDIATFNAINFTELDGSNGTPDYVTALGLDVREPGQGETLTSTCYVTDGNELAQQPSFSASVSPSFSTDLRGMRLTARLDIRHESSQYDNSLNFNSYPAVTTSNLSIGLSGDKWTATLYVNNLTDENGPRSISGFPDDTSQQGTLDFNIPATYTGYLGETWTNNDLARDSFQFQPRAPRTIGVRANYRF